MADLFRQLLRHCALVMPWSGGHYFLLRRGALERTRKTGESVSSLTTASLRHLPFPNNPSIMNKELKTRIDVASCRILHLPFPVEGQLAPASPFKDRCAEDKGLSRLLKLEPGHPVELRA